MTIKRYPGRQRVMSRQDAANMLYEQMTGQSLHRYQCTQPYIVNAIGLPSGVIPNDDGPLPLEIPTRCRKCENCLKHRRQLWTARAVDEIKASKRTWFGTLTIAPEWRFMYGMRADVDCQARGWEPIREQPKEVAFRHMVAPLNAEVTKWLKRVRKVTEQKIRYLLVSEAHKDGSPHFHILVHEVGEPIRKALLEEQWKLGFSHWRLVSAYDSKAAVYVCKYLSKDAQTRVRASVRYGQPALVRALTERLSDAASVALTVKGK